MTDLAPCPTSPDYEAGLKPVPGYDDCFWDGANMGTGTGQSFYIVDGVQTDIDNPPAGWEITRVTQEDGAWVPYVGVIGAEVVPTPDATEAAPVEPVAPVEPPLTELPATGFDGSLLLVGVLLVAAGAAIKKGFSHG